MPHIVADRVQETTIGTGTGNLTLAGAVSGFRAFSAVCANNDTFFYCIRHQASNEWEIGLGTYVSATPAIARTTLIESSTGSAINFTSGTKDVFITSPAIMQSWGALTPAQITADQNDYNPTGLAFANTLRLDADQIRNITGIAGGYDGRILTCRNVGAGSDSTIVFRRQNTGSAAANRFATTEDITIDPGGRAVFQYDGVASRWRLLSPPNTSGASMRMIPFYYTDFLGPAGAVAFESSWPWDYAVVASGTQAKTAGEANHPGILQTRCATTTNGGGYCMSDVTGILIGGGEVAEFVFRVVTMTNTTIRMGFHDSVNSSDAVDGCYIEIPTSGAAVGKTASNSTRTTSATIATLSINTWYRARIEVNDAATSVTFTIFDANGNQLGQQSNSANIPTGAGRNCGHGYVATSTNTAATNLIDMDYMSLEFDKALVR